MTRALPEWIVIALVGVAFGWLLAGGPFVFTPW